MLDKNLPVSIDLKVLDWDYLNPSFKKDSDTLFTGDIKFVAYLCDADGFGYDTKDLVYEDRYSIKLKNKATKTDFIKKLDELKSFYKSSLESLQNMNNSSYKVDKEEIVSDEKLSEMIQMVNKLYFRWPSLFAVNSNFMNKDKKPVYKGKFILSIYEKSKIGLYNGNIKKVQIAFREKEFNTYQEFSDKLDTICDRWDTFRRVKEDEKLDIFMKISNQD